MTRLVAVALWIVLAPSVALACPGCVASPYGDRTFGWAYLILYAAPFFVASAIAGALAYSLRSRRPGPAGAWLGLGLLGRRPRPGPGASAGETLALRRPQGPDKETT
jgi:peptidoglycan/LPS O-acetylase OafA/YrhL